MADKDTPTKYQLAARVARFVQLRDVRLLRVHAAMQTEPEKAFKSMPWSVGIEHSVECTAELEAQRLVHVDASFAVAGRDDNGGPVLFDVAVTFRLVYELRASKGEPVGEEMRQHLDAFAEINGIYNAWPYLREVVHNTLSRMGLPPMVVPVHRVDRSTTVQSASREDSSD